MGQILINEQPTAAVVGDTLFDHADRLGLKLPSSCGRRGSCHECIVEVRHGHEALSPRTEHEQFLRGGYRLACQCHLERNEHEVHAHALRRGAPQIKIHGHCAPHMLDPAVTRGEGGTVLLDGQPIAQSDGPLLGLAADIGTTTVVVRLLDLESGEILAAQSFENPQMFGGGDVMGRITYDRDNPGRDLQKVLIAYLNRSIGELCEQAGVQSSSIYEFVAAGNATMRDLLFGYDVTGIGERPYQSLSEKAWRAGEVTTTAVSSRPRRLRIDMNPQGRVWGVPLIACHVGADTAACLAALAMDREPRTAVMMDIGTNTELVVAHNGRLLCASCPAGPAFEGGQIACGMPGLEGAIEGLSLTSNNGSIPSITFRTIGDVAPTGICGSGLIDLLGELHRIGEMNLLGRLDPRHEEGRFWIDRAHQLYVDEHDISMLAQAKAANIAGVLILLGELGLTLEQVDVFFLAGGFASYIDSAQAVRIGMLPELPNGVIEKVGNASIEGATALLRSCELRDRLEYLVQHIEHVELENHPLFFSYFVEGCQFKGANEMIENLMACD